MTNYNIRLLISFDGTRYSGWQRQKNAPTIQGTIENAITTITGENNTLHGAGRTDAGVHALGMVAHFITKKQYPPDIFFKGLNSILPPDIRILETHIEKEDFHSRYNASGKTYQYDFYTGPVHSPIQQLYSTHYPGKLNFQEIHKCLKFLIGTHDFSSFEGSGSRDKSLNTGRGGVRTLYKASCQEDAFSPHAYSFTFTGDGFLRHMVRNLVGTLFEVGRNKYKCTDFIKIMSQKDRQSAGPTAPPQGLFLIRVHYEKNSQRTKES